MGKTPVPSPCCCASAVQGKTKRSRAAKKRLGATTALRNGQIATRDHGACMAILRIMLVLIVVIKSSYSSMRSPKSRAHHRHRTQENSCLARAKRLYNHDPIQNIDHFLAVTHCFSAITSCLRPSIRSGVCASGSYPSSPLMANRLALPPTAAVLTVTVRSVAKRCR